jgi:Tol biopolymer transport system component
MTARRALAGLLATLGAAVAASPAHATVVYVKNLGSSRFAPSVWAAADDGTGPRRLAAGANPRISPDGSLVAYGGNPVAPSYRIALRVVPAAGGPARNLLKRVIAVFDVRWAPDSRHLVAVTGPEIGPYRLVVVDALTGTSRTIDRGFFSGASFSPDGASIVYSRSPKDDFGVDTDLYVAGTAAGAPLRLTTDGRSAFPAWGSSTIAYTRMTRRRRDAPIFDLWRIQPDGSGRAAITRHRTPAPRLVSGLTPTAFSADGTKLLAEFGGQDTSYTVAVDPQTGAQRVLGPRGERGHVGAAISRDGTQVLVATGGYDPSNRGDVATVPWGGGAPTVLVRNADEPDWNR